MRPLRILSFLVILTIACGSASTPVPTPTTVPTPTVMPTPTVEPTPVPTPTLIPTPKPVSRWRKDTNTDDPLVIQRLSLVSLGAEDNSNARLVIRCTEGDEYLSSKGLYDDSRWGLIIFWREYLGLDGDPALVTWRFDGAKPEQALLRWNIGFDGKAMVYSPGWWRESEGTLWAIRRLLKAEVFVARVKGYRKTVTATWNLSGIEDAYQQVIEDCCKWLNE